MLIDDFNERFHESKAIDFPSWLTQSCDVAVRGMWKEIPLVE